MLKVVILSVTPELSLDDFDALLPLTSPEKRERIKKFHFKRDAQNCLLGDILVRIELCNTTGLTNKQLKFTVNEYGKPFLINCPGVHHNISHSGHYVACVVADEAVGIDIEIIKSADMKIAERFFARNEIEYINSGEQTRRFYEVWTKKESYIKREGKGLSIPLPSFNVFDQLHKLRITGCFKTTDQSVMFVR